VRYVTRQRPHVDRISTAWLIRRFVDPQAEFVFASRESDLSAFQALPFDVRGAELSHRGERCTFEVACETYHLVDEALDLMGLIVRGADMPYEAEVAPESAGARALFDAIRDGDLSDQERVERGFPFCDALYAYCRVRVAT
jgi:hypothetical protein